jgi:4-hydroxybenzoyl-CoA reductase subunit beta
MRLPPFIYLEPKTLDDALKMMDEYRGKVKIIAGGTEIVPLMKEGLAKPSYLMTTGRLMGLKNLKQEKNRIIIGASTTLREIAMSPLICSAFKGVAQAARSVAAPPVRNHATIGGNVLQNTRCLFRNQSELFREGLEPCHKSGGKTCHAVKGARRCFSAYQGDVAPILISFGARAKLERKGSTRIVPISELFTGVGKGPLSVEEDEILTKIILDLPKGKYGSFYEKLRFRSSIEYPLAAAAAFLSVGENGKISTARLVLGAAGPAPVVVKQASDILVGLWPTDREINAVSEFASKAGRIADNRSAPASYCRKMLGVLTRRTIRGALNDIETEKR